MNFGLSEENTQTILETIRPYKEIEQAVIFGSRAMGNFKPTSDIDIALKGNISQTVINKIWGFLNDEAPRFPYKVDVLDYNAISNAELRKYIDTYGKVFFDRAKH